MQLHFRKLGTGKPLIILHGLFGSSDNWMTLGRQFAQSYTVYLVDQRNHGRSPHHPDFNYNLLAQDLADFIKQEKLEKPYILGHSMGGKTAMQFAANFPKQLEKLIVVDIAPRAYPVHHQKILDGLNALDIVQLTGRSQADKLFANYEANMSTRQFLLKNLYRNENKHFQWRFNLPVLTEKIEQLGKAIDTKTPISVPTLFIAGTKSDYIKQEDTKLIKQLFENADIEYIVDAGHWVHAEQPTRFFEIVTSFLD